jgi:hypothetical protein
MMQTAGIIPVFFFYPNRFVPDKRERFYRTIFRERLPLNVTKIRISSILMKATVMANQQFKNVCDHARGYAFFE